MKKAKKPAKKPTKRKCAKPAAKAKTVLVLRTADAKNRSHGGFHWPKSGPISCDDWNPEPVCGQGLHGLLWGEGNGALLSWDPDAKWSVVEVLESDIVPLYGGEKVKFPRGNVVYCGDRKGATDLIRERRPESRAIVGGTSTSGDGGTSTSGNGGTSTSGDGGTSTSGNGGTSTSGYGGTSTSGNRGEIRIRYWDDESSRYRTIIGYIGEDGLLANVAYKLDDNHKFVRVE